MCLIVGWTNLARVTGLTRKALINRAARGTLPLSRKWVEGRRAFDLAEVRQWLDNETKRKKEH